MKTEFSCVRFKEPFVKHKIHWYCFLWPNHFTYKITYGENEGDAIVSTPIKFAEYRKERKYK